MNDRAQVAFEYIAVIALLVMIAAALTLFVSTIFGIKVGLIETESIWSNTASSLLGG